MKSLPPSIKKLSPSVAVANSDERWKYRTSVDPWRNWYKLRKWKKLRLKVFARDLYTCGMCKKLWSTSKGLVCDHKRPHRGIAALFWDENNLWTLCETPCHASLKQKEEYKQERGPSLA